jgi:nucleoside-diphosphate-sugar epimerase
MTSLVIGATGIVGGYIVDQLLQAGERPIALSRSTRSSATDVEWLKGDLAEPAILKLPPVTTLYCTAHAGLLANALPRFYSPLLTRVVAFTSTSIVTKIDSDIPAERETVRLWAEAEKQLIATCQELRVAWTVLRPTIIYDEGRDANITRLSRLIERFGFIPLAGTGSGLRQPVHAEDLAIGAIAAAAVADRVCVSKAVHCECQCRHGQSHGEGHDFRPCACDAGLRLESEGIPSQVIRSRSQRGCQ